MIDPRTRLRAWREWRGLTLAKAGETLGVSESYVSHVEKGRRRANRSFANALARESHDWPEGPIRSVEWDEWEARQAEDAA